MGVFDLGVFIVTCILFFLYVLIYEGFAQQKYEDGVWTAGQRRVFGLVQFSILIIGVLL